MKQLIVAYSLFLASFSSLAQSQKITGTIVPQKNKSSQLFLPNNADKSNASGSEKSKGKDSYSEYGPPPVNDNSNYPSGNDQPALSSNQYTLPNSSTNNTNLKGQQLKGVLAPEKNKSSQLFTPSNTDKSVAKEKLPAYEPPPVDNNQPYGNNIDPAQREQKISASGNYTLPSGTSSNNNNLKGQHLKGALVPKKNQAYTLQPGKTTETDKEETKAETKTEVEEAPKTAPPTNKPVPIMSAPASYAEATKTIDKPNFGPIYPPTTNSSKATTSTIEKNNRTYTAIKKNTPPPPPPSNNNGMLVPILKTAAKTTNTPSSTSANTNNAMTVAVSQNSNSGNKKNVFKSSGNNPVIIEIVPGNNGSETNNSTAKPVRNAVSNSNAKPFGTAGISKSSGNQSANSANYVTSNNHTTTTDKQKNNMRTNMVVGANNNGQNTAKTGGSKASSGSTHQNNVVVAPAKNASSSYSSDNVRHRFTFKSNGEFNVVLYAPLFTLTLSQYGKIVDYQVSDASGVAVTKNYRGLVEFIGPVYLQYDYDARLRQIANTVILYNYHGCIEKVGQTVVTYNYNKSVYSIGGNRIEYQANGTPITEQIHIP